MIGCQGAMKALFSGGWKGCLHDQEHPEKEITLKEKQRENYS